MQKKKILHLITGLGIGGTEMMLLKTLPRMQADFDNRVCCIMGHGSIGQKLEEANIPIYYLDLKNIFDLATVFRFRKIIKDFEPDILVTYLIHADLFGRVFGRLFGIKKIVCSQRGSLLQWEFLRIADRMTKSLVTKYITQTQVAKKELSQKLHLPLEKFVVIPNAIDISEFEFELDKDAKKKEFGINPGNFNIVCVSNLRRRKGHEYLLEAFEDIYTSNNKINLLLIGNGEKKIDLEDQIKNYKSKNNIFFLGKRNDVKEILKISDIFVLPTLAEGMSNAIMEAMSSKLPVITTNIPANEELITNNMTGILVEPEKSNELMEKMQILIKDFNLRTNIGMNGRQLINDSYDISIVTFKWKDLLKNL